MTEPGCLGGVGFPELPGVCGLPEAAAALARLEAIEAERRAERQRLSADNNELRNENKLLASENATLRGEARANAAPQTLCAIRGL